jgi:hypothetical protein
MKCRIIFSVLLVFAITACAYPVERDSTGVIGVWQIKDLASKDGSGRMDSKPIPSLFIFTPHHYSMVWVGGTELQRTFAERWSPTDAEKIERYNSLVVNSGTYEIEDSTITVCPIVARVPEFMGGTLVFEYRVEDDILWLTMVNEYSYDGVQAPWVADNAGLILTLMRINQ